MGSGIARQSRHLACFPVLPVQCFISNREINENPAQFYRFIHDVTAQSQLTFRGYNAIIFPTYFLVRPYSDCILTV